MKYYWNYLLWLLKLNPWKPFKPTIVFKADDKEQKVDAKYKIIGKTCHVSMTLSKDGNNENPQ